MNTFQVLAQSITNFVTESGFAQLNFGYIVMIIIACALLYLAIGKGFEPLLLVPIAFGILLVNLPGIGIKAYPTGGEPGDRKSVV